MPSYITDFTEGTKAAYEAQMIPLRAQAEADKIPLQKELDVQKVQQGRVEAETAKINLQNLMRTTAEDADSREIMQNFYKDPANQALPLDEQTKKIGQLLAGKGQFEKSLKWFDESSKATERDAKAAETRSKTEDRQMEHIRSWISDLSPDNVGQKIMMMQQSKEIPPQMAAGIRQHLDQARGDPVAFAAVKKQMMDVYQSMDGRRLRAKEFKDEETVRLAEERLAETAKHNRAIEKTQSANAGKLLEKTQIDQALKQDASLTAQLREINEAQREITNKRREMDGVIRDMEKDRRADVPETKDFFGKDPKYDAQQQLFKDRAETLVNIEAKRKQLDALEKKYNEARTSTLDIRKRLQAQLPADFRNPNRSDELPLPSDAITPAPAAKATDMTPEEENLAKKWLAKNPNDPGAPRVKSTLERLQKERDAAKAAK